MYNDTSRHVRDVVNILMQDTSHPTKCPYLPLSFHTLQWISPPRFCSTATHREGLEGYSPDWKI